MNAGILGLGSVTNLSTEDWHKTLDTNLSSIFYLSKYAISHLKKQRGTILINASIAAYKSFPNHPAYCASKAGLGSPYEAIGFGICPRNKNKCHLPWASGHTFDLEFRQGIRKPGNGRRKMLERQL